MDVHLVVDLINKEQGPLRAERLVALPAPPREGEVVWATRVFSLRVKLVSWLWEEDPTPWVWLRRSGGTPESITEDEDGQLAMSAHYIDELRRSGWTVEPNY
jgi:hypothetical protein